ncbi:hypothetical protein WJX73_007391 [Symbiochloris irregularis]|uniref:Uncharacterized protein n=1 Tax=Symbiochloris irregularis TaxID=706552 RepID=A0AAW1NMG9_9CHLO
MEWLLRSYLHPRGRPRLNIVKFSALTKLRVLDMRWAAYPDSMGNDLDRLSTLGSRIRLVALSCGDDVPHCQRKRFLVAVLHNAALTGTDAAADAVDEERMCLFDSFWFDHVKVIHPNDTLHDPDSDSVAEKAEDSEGFSEDSEDLDDLNDPFMDF